MTFGRLLLRNLCYHWRGNCAIFLGVAVGTAVLTGALLVGDSLRGSLRDLALKQLGWVHHALVSGRFFRADLANELGVPDACPALLLQGSAGSTANPGRRAGKVVLLGVDDRFWLGGRSAPDTREPAIPVNGQLWRSDDDAVVLNATLADELGVRRGDAVTLF